MGTTRCIYFLPYWSQSVPTIMILLDPQPSHEVGNFTIPILQMRKRGARGLTSEKVHSPLLIPKSFLLWNLTFTNTLSERPLPSPLPFPTRVFNPSEPSMCPSPRKCTPRLTVHTDLAFSVYCSFSPGCSQSPQDLMLWSQCNMKGGRAEWLRGRA